MSDRPKPDRKAVNDWQARTLAAFIEAASPETTINVVKKLVEQAEMGDVHAAKLYFEFVIKAALAAQQPPPRTAPRPRPLPPEPPRLLPKRVDAPIRAARIPGLAEKAGRGEELFPSITNGDGHR